MKKILIEYFKLVGKFISGILLIASLILPIAGPVLLAICYHKAFFLALYVLTMPYVIMVGKSKKFAKMVTNTDGRSNRTEVG
jgi:hypothetical protein